MKDYPKGARYKVVSDGVKWTGMTPQPGGYRGAGGPVPVGTIVTSRGHGKGWGSDPGYGYHWDVPGAEGAAFVELTPGVGGIWNYQPAEGLLEYVGEGRVA